MSNFPDEDADLRGSGPPSERWTLAASAHPHFSGHFDRLELLRADDRINSASIAADVRGVTVDLRKSSPRFDGLVETLFGW